MHAFVRTFDIIYMANVVLNSYVNFIVTARYPPVTVFQVTLLDILRTLLLPGYLMDNTLYPASSTAFLTCFSFKGPAVVRIAVPSLWLTTASKTPGSASKAVFT